MVATSSSLRAQFRRDYHAAREMRSGSSRHRQSDADQALRRGAPVYNQAIQDARVFLHAKLEDLDGEFYEPEESH